MSHPTAKYITEIAVIDPDTHLEVIVEIYKDITSGGIFGVDASFIEHEEDEIGIFVREPFNNQLVKIEE